ncbi:hypothetical protein EVAR_19364_1 [Eumeta japonica]|uniref:Uncharacterized protein n=1 Tax=Eumeta variegata TaxID=151549 RepID=A0A4C1TRG3_EUMVA|nr:hypothetical protein EVAR_19364_1 [Eumeta japonica]
MKRIVSTVNWLRVPIPRKFRTQNQVSEVRYCVAGGAGGCDIKQRFDNATRALAPFMVTVCEDAGGPRGAVGSSVVRHRRPANIINSPGGGVRKLQSESQILDDDDVGRISAVCADESRGQRSGRTPRLLSIIVCPCGRLSDAPPVTAHTPSRAIAELA